MDIQTTTGTETAAPTAPETGAPPVPAESAPAVPTPEEARLTPRFAELAKREKRAVEREAQVKAQEAAFKAQSEKYAAWEAARAKAGEDPSHALELLGVDFDKLVAAELRRGKPESIEDKVARLEAEREAERKAADENKTKAERDRLSATIESFKKDVTDYVASKPDDYELIIANDAQSEIMNVIAARHKEDGVILTMTDAAKLVEDYLLDRASKRLATSKKLGALFAPKPVVPTETPAAAEPFKPQLSNASSTGVVQPKTSSAAQGESVAEMLARKYGAAK